MVEPVVNTKYGKIEGYVEDGLKIFKGIPYAAPPVGNSRWLPPQPLKPWSGIHEAIKFAPVAPQSETTMRIMGVLEMPLQNEDCLYLNIWTPGLDNEKRPVLFWIHGGGFTIGSGSGILYNGRALVKRGNVVVITINYRLGLLGFLKLNEVTNGQIPATGNEGLLDQIAALQWVKDNISSFGGDPDNVTIFGESAGGMSCGCLLAMPGAKGLFRRAILQSGAASTARTIGNARQITEEFLKAANIRGNDITTLRTLTTEQLVKIQESFSMGGLPISPVIDGKDLPLLPLEAVRNGASADIPILVGSTLDEWNLMSQEGFGDPAIVNLTQEQVVMRLGRLVKQVPNIIEAYRKIKEQHIVTTKPGDIYSAIQTDRAFRIPAVRLAEAKQKNGQPAYHYIFTWPSALLSRLGASHATDVGYVFGTHNIRPGVGNNPAADTMAQNIQEAWLAFAKTGNPSCASIGEWLPYGIKRETMILGEKCYLANDPYGEERKIWESVPDDEVGSPSSFIGNFPTEYSEYSDTANKLAFSYPSYWTKFGAGMVGSVIAWFSSPDWRCPSVHVERLPKITADTFEKLLNSSTYLGIFRGKDVKVSKTEEMTNPNGIHATVVTFKYTAANGNVLDAKAYGFLKGDSWFVMSLYQAPTLGTLDSVKPDYIFNTWKVN